MSLFPPDDAIPALIEKILSSEDHERSCAALYRRFAAVVRAFFRKRHFSPSESEELTQDTFLRVFEHIRSLRDHGQFRRWLFEIATNVYRNELRRRGTDMRSGYEVSIDGDLEADGIGRLPLKSALAAREADPLSKAVRDEQHELLRQAILKLPSKMRQCAYLRFCEQREYHEIALLMRVSIQTVKAHLYAAKGRLATGLVAAGSDRRTREGGR